MSGSPHSALANASSSVRSWPRLGQTTWSVLYWSSAPSSLHGLNKHDERLEFSVGILANGSTNPVNWRGQSTQQQSRNDQTLKLSIFKKRGGIAWFSILNSAILLSSAFQKTLPNTSFISIPKSWPSPNARLIKNTCSVYVRRFWVGSPLLVKSVRWRFAKK